MLFASAPVGDTGWVLVLEVPKSEILAPIMKMGAIVAVVILLSIAMLIAIILYITRSIATRQDRRTGGRRQSVAQVQRHRSSG